MSDHTDLRDQIARALYKGPTTNPARSDEPISDAFVTAVYRLGRTTEAQLAYEAADKVLPVLAEHTAAQDTRITALQAQVDAITALHAPETHYHWVNPYGWAADCDHCYGPVRDTTGALTPAHFEDTYGELRCRTRPRRICTHCVSNWGNELAGSIAEVGVLQPIKVRYDRSTRIYTIIMGERRWRAARIAGLAEIPATVEHGQGPTLLAQTAENTGRADMTSMEEGLDIDQIASACGKSFSYVQWRIDLLGLVGPAREALDKGHPDVGCGLVPVPRHRRGPDAVPDRWVRSEFTSSRDVEMALQARREAEDQGELFAVPEMSEEEKARLRASRKKTATSFDRLSTAGQILADLAAMDPAELARQLSGVNGGPGAYQDRVEELKKQASRTISTLRKASALVSAGEFGQDVSGQAALEEH